MISDLNINTAVYTEFYSLVYIATLTIGILVFSCTSSYKQTDLIYLSDINYLIRFTPVYLMLLFFFCLFSGIPPFISFTSKFLVLYLIKNSFSLFFILINVITILIFYLSIFKYLKVKPNYKKKGIQFISFNCFYICLVFFFFNILSPFISHVFLLDLV